jgi:hypothetical protein
MNKRVGVISIDLNRLKGTFGSNALSLSGNNFGNMLFTNAIYNQIPNCKHVDFIFNKAKVKTECDHIVIPASNWINATEDWGFLADALEELNVPICLVGLGSQLENENQVDLVSDGTKRFLKVVSERSSSIGVRGHYTKKILSLMGFNNTVALGCPSIFSKNKLPEVRTNFPLKNIRIGVGPTRYWLPKANQLKEGDKQRQLYQFAIRHASSIYYQSEAFEIAFLNREAIKNEVADSLAYYNLTDKFDFENKLMTKGKYHKDLDQWLADAIKDDIYIGTRIHGAVASILAGTPAILITHDNRTRELAYMMGIPSIDIEKFEISMLNDIHGFIHSFDYSEISRASESNIDRFRKFYSENGLLSAI